MLFSLFTLFLSLGLKCFSSLKRSIELVYSVLSDFGIWYLELGSFYVHVSNLMSTASYAAIIALISKLGVVMYQDVDEQHNMLHFLF